jgi:hypothetical protein
MGSVESKMLDYIKRRLEEGELSVSVPSDHPEFRERTGYRLDLGFSICRILVWVDNYWLNGQPNVRSSIPDPLRSG